jgi:predicted nucleotidyltransferase
MEAAELEAVARRHGVQLIVQHGSTVSGRTHARSDLDLAVLLGRPPCAGDRYDELVGQLQALCPGREVDVVRLDGADPLLLKRVTDNCTLLYGPPGRLQELKLYAFKRYQDYRRFLAFEREYVRRRLAAAGR